MGKYLQLRTLNIVMKGEEVNWCGWSHSTITTEVVIKEWLHSNPNYLDFPTADIF